MVAFAYSEPFVKDACCSAYKERERKFVKLIILDLYLYSIGFIFRRKHLTVVKRMHGCVQEL